MKSCWRALGVVVGGTTLVGCIKIAPFAQKDGGGDVSDAPGDGDVTSMGAVAVVNGAGVDVTNGSLYQVLFSSESFHFPYAMTVGSTSILGGGNVGCAEEYDVGIGLYPAGRIIGHAATNVVQDDIRIEFAGPPVAKVALDWGTQFPCGGNARTVTGRSTFTFFPDGHINRSDRVLTGQALDSTACNCGGSDNWYISSFLTANAGVVQDVIGATLPSDMGPGNDFNDSWGCFRGFNNAYQFAMGWRLPLTSRLRTPITGQTIAFVRDLVVPNASTTFDAGELEAQTTWWVATDSTCTALVDKVRPYADNSGLSLPTLNIRPGTGTTVSAGVALDGIFGGENGQGSMGYQSSAPDVHLTVNADIGPFAFWLALTSGEEIASVTKSPSTPTDTWYSQQTRNGSNHRLFWFPDGLTTTEEIVIHIQ